MDATPGAGPAPGGKSTDQARGNDPVFTVDDETRVKVMRSLCAKLVLVNSDGLSDRSPWAPIVKDLTIKDDEPPAESSPDAGSPEAAGAGGGGGGGGQPVARIYHTFRAHLRPDYLLSHIRFFDVLAEGFKTGNRDPWNWR